VLLQDLMSVQDNLLRMIALVVRLLPVLDLTSVQDNLSRMSTVVVRLLATELLEGFCYWDD
jgi:hypothetical protein